MNSVRLPHIDAEIAQFKRDASPIIVTILAVVCLIFLPLTIQRMHLTELNSIPEYLLFTVYIATFIAFRYRHQITYEQLIYLVLYACLVTCFVEFNHYGVMGAGEMIAMLAVMLSLFHLSKRITTLLIVALSLMYFSAMYQFTQQDKALSLPADLLKSSLVPWVSMYLSVALFFVLTGFGTVLIHRRMVALGDHLEAQNAFIEEQKQRIEFLANHDALTGLPSLRLVSDRLDHAIAEANEHGHKAALLFLDLDGFKPVNDTYGHDAGDSLLKTISERIHGAISDQDTVGRIGGDEFLVILHQVRDRQHIEQVCAELINVVSQPVVYQQHTLQVGASIGAATYPNSARCHNDLRARADELMYKVKRSGKNSYRID